MSTCIFEDPLAIFFLCYSSVFTIALVISLYCIFRLKKCTSFQKDNKDVESIDKLNRRSAINKYEFNGFSPELRNHVNHVNHVNVQRVVSEYDSLTCSVKHTYEDSPENEESIYHQYEEVNEMKPRFRPFETVLDEAAKALVAVYQDSSSADIYNTFLTILTSKIKAKNPQMFQTIRNSGVMAKNQYEAIIEEKPKASQRRDEIEDEPKYQMYFPLKEEKSTAGNFGSDEHVKYLVESRNAKTAENEGAYLEAKRFSAASNCPDHLRRLCEAQGSERNPRGTFTLKQQEKVMLLYNNSSNKLWPNATIPKSASSRTQCERSKKGPPLPPHKPSKCEQLL